MSIQIRRATEEDVTAINRIYLYGDTYHAEAVPDFMQVQTTPARSAAFLRDCIHDDMAAVFLAEKDGGVVSMLHILERRSPDFALLVPRRYALIEAVVVLPQAIRCGVGTALVRYGEAWAQSRGFDQVELGVWEFNAGAQRFYSELGFETIRRTMWKKLDSAPPCDTTDQDSSL